MTRYKEPRLQEHYDLMLSFAHNRGPELFTPDGGQRRGAGHRNAFWNGYNGLKNIAWGRGTYAYVAYYAGRQFAKDCARP